MTFGIKKLFLFISAICIALAIASQLPPAGAFFLASVFMLVVLPFVPAKRRRFFVYSTLGGFVFMAAAVGFIGILIQAVHPQPPRSPKSPPDDVNNAMSSVASYLIVLFMLAGALFGFYLAAVQQRHEDNL